MADTACHVLCSTALLGLTWVLGRLDNSHLYRYKVSLSLTHPRRSAAELGRALPLQACHEGTVGEPRRTPKGRPLGGQYKESFWRVSLPTPADGELERFLASTVESLAPNLPHILVGGGEARLF